MFPIKDTIPSRNTPIVTWILILVNAVVFLFELTLSEHQLVQFFYLFGLVPARYTHPAWAMWVGLPVDTYWPLLTHIFVHGGWMHIIANMWALWIFGDNVEDRMGPVRFLTFYLLCGLAAGAVHMLVNADSTVPSVGASGAIAGVMGAYFYMFPYSRIVVLLPIFFFPFFFELPAVIYLGFWALAQLFSGTFSVAAPNEVGGVAWWAHIGGFVTGMVLHFAFVKNKAAYRRLEPDEYRLERAWLPGR